MGGRYGSALHGIQHVFHLLVYLGFTGILIFKLQLHLRTIEAGSQLQNAPAVLGTVDGTPVLTVPIAVVQAAHWLSLIEEGQSHVIAVTAVEHSLQVAQRLVYLLLAPVGQHVLLASLVFTGHRVGVLQSLDQGECPVVVAQYVVHLAFLLSTEGRFHHVDGLKPAGLENLLYFRLLDPAHHVGLRFTLQHPLLRVSQRSLRVGANLLRKLRALVNPTVYII